MLSDQRLEELQDWLESCETQSDSMRKNLWAAADAIGELLARRRVEKARQAKVS